MPLRDRPWYPWLSAALWGLVVFALVLVNSGNVVLAVVLGLVVAVISQRIDRSRQQ
ncbi:MAG: hypothetical protein JWM62_2222 [Frankiales bacterium]|jgi:hypothetical protein|nr:hypothetical protein [Frankiales bacterium]